MLKKYDYSMTLRLATALVASMVTFTVVAQPKAPTPRPQLVIGIVVDGLQDDYLDLLKGYFGEGGFKRLMRDGVMLENVDFGTQVDASAATAMIYSGASASASGISAANYYDPEQKRTFAIIHDPQNIGNYTDETYSPRAVRVSTISDEVRIDGGGIGSVYAVAPSAQSAVIMAGHAGNSAFWINDVNGKWSTTTYYKDVPQPMSGRNHMRPLANRLDTLAWRPMIAPDQYPDLPAYKKVYPFRHLFQRTSVDRFRNYKTSAPVNTEVTDVAVDYINVLKLGNHDAMDMLNLGYTVVPFASARDADNRIETMDAYLRLDRDLERLFQTIDKNVGLDKTFVFLAGTPAPASTKRDDEKWGIPNGEFSSRKAISLLNMYFMAKHGQGEWVTGYYNGHLFLNKKLIQDRGLQLAEMRSDAADFLTRMSGVSRVWTIDAIVAGKAGANADALKRNTQIDYSGDLVLEVTPGWEIVSIDPLTQKEQRNTVRTGLISAPVFMLSPVLEAKRISEPIDARAIAPTVTRQLRIRSPNASEMPPMRLQIREN